MMDEVIALGHQVAAASERDYIRSGWLRERLPGRIQCSHRQTFFPDTSLVHEEIVLEEIPISLEDRGTETIYPQLRRRK